MNDSARTLSRSVNAALVVANAFLWIACSGSSAGDAGTGGSSVGAGGSATGGTALGGGGAGSMTGGRDATGGGVQTGGTANSGANSGGATSGGTADAGRSSGGATSGGTADAGRSSGGADAGKGGSGKGGAGLGTGGASNGGGGAGGANGGKSNAGGGGAAGSTSAGGSATAGTGGSGGAVTSPGCGASDPLKSGRATLDVSGSSREFILKMPDNYDSSHPYKLIFAFHARGGNAVQVAGSGNNDYYGLFSRSAGKAIFVSPEGIDAGWRNENGRDIAFVKAMLSHFNSKLCIDQQRIFSAGFSFGGMMSDAIGCAMADVFRAIAPMSGGVPNAEHPYSGCDQVNMHPIAVWMSHGDNDTVVPLADGKAALDIFVKRSKCQAQTSPVTPSPCVAYQGCMPDYPITFCQFSGGHGVPNFASQAIWDFFNQF